MEQGERRGDLIGKTQPLFVLRIDISLHIANHICYRIGPECGRESVHEKAEDE
jgi:hypothetical protein